MPESGRLLHFGTVQTCEDKQESTDMLRGNSPFVQVTAYLRRITPIFRFQFTVKNQNFKTYM